MKKRLAVFGSAALLALGAAYPAAADNGGFRVAQDETGTTEEDDDGGFDLGWLGLLGLAGLAGLRRKDDRDRARVTVDDRTNR